MHGNWGEWEAVNQCDVSCGGGQQLKTRLCNNPAPLNGGLDCLLSVGVNLRGEEERKTEVCNNNKCPTATTSSNGKI